MEAKVVLRAEIEKLEKRLLGLKEGLAILDGTDCWSVFLKETFVEDKEGFIPVKEFQTMFCAYKKAQSRNSLFRDISLPVAMEKFSTIAKREGNKFVGYRIAQDGEDIDGILAQMP